MVHVLPVKIECRYCLGDGYMTHGYSKPVKLPCPMCQGAKHKAIVSIANTALKAHGTNSLCRVGVIMRYFFNLAGAVHDPDNAGQVFDSLSDARCAAAKYAGEYLRDRPEIVWLGEEFRIEVTDEERVLLFTFIAVGVDAPAQEGRLRM